MSIILDALKKLEQKQQQDAVPNLSTIHTPNLHKPKKRPFWPYLLLIALLINAGILTAWLRPWSSEVEDTSVQTTVSDHQDNVYVEKADDTPDVTLAKATPAKPVKTAETPTDTIKSVPPSNPDIADPSPSLKPADEPAAIVTEKPDSESTEAASVQSSPEEQIASLDLSPSVEELETLKETIKAERELAGSNNIPANEPSSDSYEDKLEREILELSELPTEIRKEIPDISIIGHIYSSRSSSRLANINGSLVREGDTVTGKLKVREITMTGVIFDYEGLRFRVRAF